MTPKHIPEVAEARTQIARNLRKMRKENPELARLVLRRMKIAAAEISADFWGHP